MIIFFLKKFCPCSRFLFLSAFFSFFKFIKENKDAEIERILPGEVSGLKELITEDGLLRIFPDHLSEIGGMDGFFIARLKKVS